MLSVSVDENPVLSMRNLPSISNFWVLLTGHPHICKQPVRLPFQPQPPSILHGQPWASTVSLAPSSLFPTPKAWVDFSNVTHDHVIFLMKTLPLIFFYSFLKTKVLHQACHVLPSLALDDYYRLFFSGLSLHQLFLQPLIFLPSLSQSRLMPT